MERNNYSTVIWKIISDNSNYCVKGPFFNQSFGWYLPSFLLSRFSCAHLQSDDQDAGHLGGLLHVEELRLLSPGWPDTTWGETGVVLVSCKRRSHMRDLAWLIVSLLFFFLLRKQDEFSKINFIFMYFCAFADLYQRIQWAQQLEVHLHVEHQSWRAGYQLGYSRCGHPVRLRLEPSSRPSGHGWYCEVLNCPFLIQC